MEDNDKSEFNHQCIIIDNNNNNNNIANLNDCYNENDDKNYYYFCKKLFKNIFNIQQLQYDNNSADVNNDDDDDDDDDNDENNNLINQINSSIINKKITVHKEYAKLIEKSENIYFNNNSNFKYKRRKNFKLNERNTVMKSNDNNKKNNNIINKNDKRIKFNKNKNETFINNNNNNKNYILLIIYMLINEIYMCIKKLCQYARCIKMLNNNNCAIGYISLMIYFLVFLGSTDMTEAGACWVARMSNGKCKELFSKNVSRDECCKYGQEFAYTDTDMSDVEYFFAAAIGDGATCVSCLDSCDVAKCGIGKRCIIRKGRPKCVCAPICKASKDKKMKKNHNNNSNSNRTDDNNNSVRVIEHEKLKQLNTFNNVPRNRQIFDLSSNPGQNQEQQQQQQQNNEQNQQQNFNRDWFPIPVSITIPAPAASSKIQVSIESIPLHIPDNNKEKQKHKNKQKQTEKFNTIVINNNTNVTIIENKKRKNQRKSDLTKRKNQNSGKFSTDDTIIKNHNDKRIKLNNNDNNNNNNNNGIIYDGKRANHSTKLERTIKLKKNLNTKTKNIVIVKSNPSESDIVTENVLQHDLEQQQQQQQKHKQQQHHNRHEYKKKRKLQKQQKLQHNASQNLTIPINNVDLTTSITTIMNTNINSRKYHQQQQQKRRRPISNRMENTKIDHSINMVTTTTTRTIHQEHNYYNQMTLDEKIRNGFFNHGFPYTQLYSTEQQQMTHGRYYNPVCGTDGKTYKTECQLKKRACRRETSLTVAYRGHCQTSCKLVHCLDGLTCVEDQYGIPHCISCTISCPQDDVISDVIDPTRAVCGIDGRTYKSICDINRMICITGRSIAVAYYGPCQESANCNNIHCGQRKICLTDLVTHKPRCISCSFKCPRKRRPQGQKYEDVKICGNNNHTYYSWCHMRRDSCNTEFYIDVRHVGPCHKDSFKRDEKLPQFY